ncbi:uncharacterized protein K460DRAFT_422869 [Cucurbitaria berberidis CBS 394.84]|uniref:Uncharacterized protein n=1 Tax=Cucurbitaria berberidis CBS 394.84 TaxID=1168544 RepID=A0A9P4LDH9_9PLEO|nr:uncharacterized protein K460DRAFT_422869 [Cucurbitaria berberidis CBS 394.84]KAF1850417.1 hypothetical protein K460DRAFT_422869 [Cucurbitaria berberidis CBS 394.84]
MRLLKFISLLVATVPVIVSFTIPPPDGLCREGAQRCHKNDLEECNAQGQFKLMQACTKHQVCTISKTGTHDRVGCLSSQPTSIPGPVTPTKRSESIPAPEMCHDVDQQRCITHGDGKGIEKCSKKHQWVMEKVCQTPGSCIEHDGQAVCSSTRPVSPRGHIPETCVTTGSKRCNGITIEECDVEHRWISKEVCYKTGRCEQQKGDAYCRPRFFPPMALEPCTSGERTCDTNAYILMKCGDDHIYTIEKKCTTPGDCKIDGPGQAHCKQGGIDPPMAKHDELVCKSNGLACEEEG